jgi:hypothetical protein
MRGRRRRIGSIYYKTWRMKERSGVRLSEEGQGEREGGRGVRGGGLRKGAGKSGRESPLPKVNVEPQQQQQQQQGLFKSKEKDAERPWPWIYRRG